MSNHMGRTVTAPQAIIAGTEAGNIRKPTIRAATPPVLADVALIDGPTCAAGACISVSQWHELVKEGEAPPPAFRAPRCTRWRLADVRAWLVQRAERGNQAAAQHVVAQAQRASTAAKAKRLAEKARE
jgi:predicted DNA-binding transcriptional regulator AlpA